MSERRKQRAAYHGERTEEEVICPKPRRATSVSGPLTEFMNPSRRRRSRTTVRGEGDAGFEILDIFLSKGVYNDTSNFACSPPYFCGSPPSRSGNPLIHDIQFVHQRAQSVLSQQILSCVPSSYKANPVVALKVLLHLAPIHAVVSLPLHSWESHGALQHLQEKLFKEAVHAVWFHTSVGVSFVDPLDTLLSGRSLEGREHGSFDLRFT